MEYEKKFCAFIDILGFKKLMKDSFDKAVKFYESYMAIFKVMAEGNKSIHEQLNDGYDLDYFIYSDSIIVISKNWNVFCQCIATTCSWMLENGFLFRGGIGFGKIHNQSKFPDVKMVSEGLVEAVLIESEISQYPRIVLSETALKEIIKSVTNIYPVQQLFIQCEDNYWCINPVFLSPDIRPIIKMINEKMVLYKDEKFINKYEWLAEFINYFTYWASFSLKNRGYFFKSHVESDIVEKMFFKTPYSSTLRYKFIYPKLYLGENIDLRIYSQSFEENAKYIESQKNKI